MSAELPAKELLQAALEISKRRGKMLDQMHDAFAKGDVQKAIRLAKELCGYDEKGNRTYQGKH